MYTRDREVHGVQFYDIDIDIDIDNVQARTSWTSASATHSVRVRSVAQLLRQH